MVVHSSFTLPKNAILNQPIVRDSYPSPVILPMGKL